MSILLWDRIVDGVVTRHSLPATPKALREDLQLRTHLEDNGIYEKMILTYKRCTALQRARRFTFFLPIQFWSRCGK